HHGLNRGCLYENGFRELQPIDLLRGNYHHLKPLKNGPLRKRDREYHTVGMDARMGNQRFKSATFSRFAVKLLNHPQKYDVGMRYLRIDTMV
ncbi:hypothetical protein, partial [Acidithiobacillus ferrooxidans]|uniref:hypothetical protein n=1 Tax=Acidithiobacillus ferrooxidans TaxID=920 RepID=UPI000B2D4B01